MNFKYRRHTGIYYTNILKKPFILKVVLYSKTIKNLPILKMEEAFGDNKKHIEHENIFKSERNDIYYVIFRKAIYPNMMYCIDCDNTYNIEEWKE